MKPIWIIDEDLVLGALLVRRLHAFGFESQVIVDPHEALVRLGTDDSPKIILTELLWPYYSPNEWVSALSQKSPQSHVIAVTTIEDPIILAKVFDSGVSDYMVKPFDFRTLIEKIQHISQSDIRRYAHD